MKNEWLKERQPVVYKSDMIKLLPNRRILPHQMCFIEHWHERMELLRIFEGSVRLKLRGKELTVSAGEVAIIPPEHLHEGYGGEDGAFYDCIMFDISNFYNKTVTSRLFLEPINRNSVEFSPITDDEEIVSLFDRIAKLDSESGIRSSLESVGCIYALLGLLYDKCAEIKKDSFYADEESIDLIQYIDNHFCEKLSAELICKKFNYSKAYLCRKFKALTGFTISEYVRGLRLERAEKLLYETKKEIRHISAECGFPNERIFSKNFKEHFGKSPSEFRKHYFEDGKQ